MGWRGEKRLSPCREIEAAKKPAVRIDVEATLEVLLFLFSKCFKTRSFKLQKWKERMHKTVCSNCKITLGAIYFGRHWARGNNIGCVMDDEEATAGAKEGKGKKK